MLLLANSKFFVNNGTFFIKQTLTDRIYWQKILTKRKKKIEQLIVGQILTYEVRECSVLCKTLYYLYYNQTLNCANTSRLLYYKCSCKKNYLFVFLYDIPTPHTLPLTGLFWLEFDKFDSTW